MASEYPEPRLQLDIEQRFHIQLIPEQPHPEIPEPHTTEEGFCVNGSNDTDAIRQLTTLNGMSIDGIGETIGLKQPLTEHLAEHNDTAQELDLTHTDLANHLQYCQKLCHTHGLGGGRMMPFAYNNLPFAIKAMSFRHVKTSPFDGSLNAARVYDVTRLDTGEGMTFNNQGAHALEGYGYYGHLEPASLHDFFTAGADSDDPVVRLTKGKGDGVVIKSQDEVRRLSRLQDASLPILAENFSIAPQDIETIGTLLHMTRHKAHTPHEAIDEKITIEPSLTPQEQTVKIEDLVHLLKDGQELPKAIEAALAMTDAVTLQDTDSGFEASKAREVIETAVQIHKQSDNNTETPLTLQLFSRLNTHDPYTLAVVYQAAAKLQENSRVDGIADMLDAHLPSFRTQLMQEFEKTPSYIDTGTADNLLSSHETLKDFHNQVIRISRIANDYAKVELDTERIVGLFNLCHEAQEKHRLEGEFVLSDEATSLLTENGIDPDLFPLALEAYEQPVHILGGLYSGTVEKERVKRKYREHLSQTFDETVIHLVEKMKRWGSSYNEEKMKRIDSTLETLSQRYDSTEAEDTREKIGEQEFLREFSTQAHPAFRELLHHSSFTIDSLGSNVYAVIDEGLLAEAEEVENPYAAYPKLAKQLVLRDEENKEISYYISQYAAYTSGEAQLTLQSTGLHIK